MLKKQLNLLKPRPILTSEGVIGLNGVDPPPSPNMIIAKFFNPKKPLSDTIVQQPQARQGKLMTGMFWFLLFAAIFCSISIHIAFLLSYLTSFSNLCVIRFSIKCHQTKVLVCTRLYNLHVQTPDVRTKYFLFAMICPQFKQANSARDSVCDN